MSDIPETGGFDEPKPTQVLTIERSRPGERLDSWLRSELPNVSRGAIQRLIEEGHIRVNGNKVKPTHTPRAGDRVEVEWPAPKSSSVQPEDIPLEILYEDEALLVLNKPPGLVVHPASGHETKTLVNALLHHCRGNLSGIGGVARPGIVHRLDKDTSGCMVVAKNDDTHVALSAQFASRKVEKIYHAIVCGEMGRDRGEIHAAIARHSSHRKCMTVDEEFGREAHTSYQVLQRLHGATLAMARLHTGRTHQVRVHFKFLGYPLLGDETYGHRQNHRLAELTGYQAPRQMLHAFHLGFVHPRTGRKLGFEAPQPEDFKDALAALRQSD
ncbi:MAG TPA: RluA family pseudouridine synthase [Verrucomicrobiae bacterium]|nr:RluA family pseudouridine synthase [Verrucomicrobiae bacterium]